MLRGRDLLEPQGLSAAMRLGRGPGLLGVALWAAAGCGGGPDRGTSAQRPADADSLWKSEWAVADSFSLEIDSEGFEFPTAIAFVPDPGLRPDDPLYFVTELRGAIKVVTRDRTVRIFARDFFQFAPAAELPNVEGENGLAGICLDPAHGYVFVTFVYHDSTGLLRNNVARFTTRPGTFALAPSSRVEFTEVFARDDAAVSHQIGNCQVAGDRLHIGVGDAHRTFPSQRLDSVLGKVLRLTLDGLPAPENPFYRDDDVRRAANFVYAYGLRNPFGISVVNGRVFVADNGPAVDRFLEVLPGKNYLWDGTDWSIATNAAVVFPVSSGPAQIAYVPPLSGDESATAGAGPTPESFPDSHRGRFFVALSGGPGRGVLALEYDFAAGELASPPKEFVRFRGLGVQSVVGVSAGPDGLYFAPLYPLKSGRSVVFKVRYDPRREHPHVLAGDLDAVLLMYQKGCVGCHDLPGEPAIQGSRKLRAPSLEQRALRERLEARLASPAYPKTLARLEASGGRSPAHAQLRRWVLAARGRERVRRYIQGRILEPKFDNPASQMPDLDLSEREALVITDFLMREEPPQSPVARRALLPEPRRWHILVALVGGLALGAVGVLAVRRRRSRSP